MPLLDVAGRDAAHQPRTPVHAGWEQDNDLLQLRPIVSGQPSPPGLERSVLLRLQRDAGNRATAALVQAWREGVPARRPAVQRCGSTPADQCGCHGEPADAPVQRMADELPVQRDTGEADATTSGPTQSWATAPALGRPIRVDMATGRQLVDAFIKDFGPNATKVIPWREEAVATSQGAAPEGGPVAQATLDQPVVQRLGGGTVDWEAGVVGSIQVCYDLCTGEISLVGWIWAGGGVKTSLGWYGAYLFAEQEFWRGNPGLGHLDCGTCAPACKPVEGGHDLWGSGLAGFPIVIKPGEWARLKQAGLEVGFLLTPHVTRCDADLEVIALIDLIKYLGPIGAGVSAAERAMNRIAERFGLKVECGLGLDISGAAHLCKSVPGGGIKGITADKGKICGGGYVACGIGLSHDRNALPGGGAG